jgi:hypothetical protein
MSPREIRFVIRPGDGSGHVLVHISVVELGSTQSAAICPRDLSCRRQLSLFNGRTEMNARPARARAYEGQNLIAKRDLFKGPLRRVGRHHFS